MKRLPAYEFAQAVDSAISSQPRQDIYLRKGRAKRLVEELYPISRFALQMVFPGSRIEVEAPEDDSPYDGLIHRGPEPESTLSIQVTYIYSYEDALRDELLWKSGSAPGTGPIHRDKKTQQIVAQFAPVPIDQEIDKRATDIVTRNRCVIGVIFTSPHPRHNLPHDQQNEGKTWASKHRQYPRKPFGVTT